MKIGRTDLLWNYGASFMRVASALVVLPLILKMLPREEMGLWSVMISLNSMIYLLDFGFFPTFSRSITYIFSGATTLQAEGFKPLEKDLPVHYPLLKGMIKSMRNFYAGVAVALVILLFTAGIWYIESILQNFTGDIFKARLAWYCYGLLLSYQFYTYFYDAMLVGRGMVKRSKQIIVFSQSLHIVTASILLISGMGIMSMVIGQTIATIINRFLAYRTFYDVTTKEELKKADAENWREILKKIWTTAYKSGLSGLSWIFTNRILALLGALFIPLSVMGDYGLSKQIADVIYTLSVVWFVTFYPKLTQNRIQERIDEVKRVYIKALYIAVAVFAVCTSGVLLLGEWGLDLINSKTHFIEWPLLLVLFVATLFDAFTYISTSVLLSRNEVPHYKAQVITAIITVIILLAALQLSSYRVAALVLVPFACQLLYNHWRWTGMVWLELGVIKKSGEKHAA
ncbi:MAG TPA: hypothetical protein DEG92_05565 [Rikenellaceae bacterium]|nr:hypothetical protein [Rikenellaceae bacterium]